MTSLATILGELGTTNRPPKEDPPAIVDALGRIMLRGAYSHDGIDAVIAGAECAMATDKKSHLKIMVAHVGEALGHGTSPAQDERLRHLFASLSQRLLERTSEKPTVNLDAIMAADDSALIDKPIGGNEAGICPIHEAARLGHREFLAWAVESRGADILLTQTARGRTVAHYLAVSFQTELCQFMYSIHQALASWPDYKDRTPMHYQIEKNFPEVLASIRKIKEGKKGRTASASARSARAISGESFLL